MRRIRCAALCLALILALTQGASAASAVLERAVEIISKMETSGNYGAASNDSGGPSVGILQWHNERAVSLLKKVIAEDPEGAKALLGDALYDQLSTGKTSVWNGKTLSAEKRAAVGALLKSDAGVRCQKAQAEKDISAYIEKAKGLGITDANALVYYADIHHQVGSGAVKKYGVKAADIAGGYGKITLKALYQAALVYATHTKARRTKVYNMLAENPVAGAAAADVEVLPERVSLSPSGTRTLYLGDTLKLTAAVSPSNATAQYTWKTSKSSVATVSGGVVTPKKKGTATITVKTQNGKTASVKVKVKPVLVERVSITGEAAMQRGKKQALTAVCTPENATNQSVRWRSSNSRVLAVNSKGVVLARRKGKATVYCMTKDGTKKVGKLVIRVK